MEHFNHDKFTIIAWDPPGYGNSRPPKREYKLERTYTRDADLALQLMAKLGYAKYSLLGWSDGGKTAMMMAIKKPGKKNSFKNISLQSISLKNIPL